MGKVTLVMPDGGTFEDVQVFEDPDQAEIWAELRGGCDYMRVTPISQHDADLMIREEVKERKDEERMKQAGL